MKSGYICLVVVLLMPLLCFSCSPQLYLQKRTNRLVDKLLLENDSIYVYSIAFHNYNLIWFHNGNSIQAYRIEPYNAPKYKSIPAESFILYSDSVDYFDRSLDKDVACFRHMLDGESIELHLKDGVILDSSVDTQCLFNKKFMRGSFPYQLQYDLFKLGRAPKGYNFEEVYSLTELSMRAMTTPIPKVMVGARSSDKLRYVPINSIYDTL